MTAEAENQSAIAASSHKASSTIARLLDEREKTTGAPERAAERMWKAA